MQKIQFYQKIQIFEIIQMFNFLFALLVSYNRYIGDCYAIIDQYEYDLTQFIDKDPYFSESNSYTYVIRLCPNTVSGDKEDVFMLQCPKDFSSACRDIITQNSLNFKPRNPKNFSEGVIYYAEGEPFTEDGQTYKTLDLEFDLICDPQSTADKIDFTYTYDDEVNIGQVSLRGKTSAACPKVVQSPTPTPVYEPDCKYTDRKDDDTDVGIDGDLKTLNDGPFGVKTILTIDGKNKSLFFQACERMLCPPTYNCSTTGYSSAWLCDEESGSRNCISYGVGSSDPDLRPVDTSLANGMIYHMNDTSTNKSIELTLTCSSSFPEGHILWSNLGVMIDNTLSIGGKTKEFCLRVIPTPTPQPEGGSCVFNKTMNNRKISIDLETFNKGQSGWSINVSVETDSALHPDSTLIYQPCGGVICPPDTYCDGDEDAQVWLCYELSGSKECIGYGLTKYNVSINLADQSSLSNGLSVGYTGDNRRFADVTYYCDPFLAPDVLILPAYVTLVGRRLSFYVSSKGACPFNEGPSYSPSPQPYPTATKTPVPKPWHPKKPSKPSEPTPTPQPTVSPDFVVHNDTHYAMLSLDQLSQPLFEGNAIVTHNKSSSSLFMTWHPWILTDCPNAHSCDDFSYSNLWLCWTEDDSVRYCHPAADKTISLDMRFTEEGADEVSNGVVINYGGGYGFATKIVSKCNIFETESLKFDDGADFTYHDDNNGRLTIIIDSKLTCPKELATPTIPPTPLPSPPVDPHSKVDRHFTSKVFDGQVIDLDLAEIGSFSQTVFVKTANKENNEVYRSSIFFNPAAVQPCPSGFTCVSSEKSSLWSCFNSTTVKNVCVPIGDDRFGLGFQLLENKRSPHNDAAPNGVSVKYSGGYDLAESTIEFICNTDSVDSSVTFQDVAQKSGNSFTFSILTNLACPVKSTARGAISGGAVFLILVIVVFVLYFSIGTLVEFIRNGSISIPNSKFWTEFYICVITSINFIFSCGKKTILIKNEANYDSIN